MHRIQPATPVQSLAEPQYIPISEVERLHGNQRTSTVTSEPVEHHYENWSGATGPAQTTGVYQGVPWGAPGAVMVTQGAVSNQHHYENGPGKTVFTPPPGAYGVPVIHLPSKINIILRAFTGLQLNYFHENINQDEAEALLGKDLRSRVYLFRESSKEGMFAVSYKEPNKEGGFDFGRALLRFDDQRICMEVDGEPDAVFDNMEAFIKQSALSSSALLGV